MSDIDAVPSRTPFETSQTSISESITALGDCTDVVPTQAVLQARAHWDDFFPALLEAMRKAIATTREGEDPGEVAFWGVGLIAERERGEVDQALPVLVEILALPDDQIDLLIGDLLTEMMPQALASAAGDQIPLLEQMLGDPAIDVYARWTIGEAVVQLVAEQILPRERAVDILHGRLRRILEQHKAGTYSDDPFYPSVIIRELTRLLPHGAVDDMLAACQAELVEEFAVGEDEIRRRSEAGESAFQDEMQAALARRVDDCLAVLEPWYARDEDFDWSASDDGQFDEEEAGEFARDQNATVVVQTLHREQARVGRNDACPCGSGRKYKKCCGRS